MSQIERHNQDIHVGLETYLPILPRFRPLILRGFGGRTRFRHLVKTKSNIRTESLIHRTVITIPMWHWEPSQTSMNCACACICLSQKRGKKSNFTVTCFLFFFYMILWNRIYSWIETHTSKCLTANWNSDITKNNTFTQACKFIRS